MRNIYWENSKKYEKEIVQLTREIFQEFNNKLYLKIGDTNLLKYENNCIVSSTALGFILEEFVISHLIEKTKNNSRDDTKICVRREHNSTQQTSFDFFSVFFNDLYLVNVKVQKNNGNNAIAALNCLHSDYSLDHSFLERNKWVKHYLILKINYCIENEFIKIGDIESFFLEKINFEINNYKSDNRNWSKEFNANSGRLMISKKFIEKNTKKDENISHESTKKQINEIYDYNEKMKSKN